MCDNSMPPPSAALALLATTAAGSAPARRLNRVGSNPGSRASSPRRPITPPPLVEKMNLDEFNAKVDKTLFELHTDEYALTQRFAARGATIHARNYVTFLCPTHADLYV